MQLREKLATGLVELKPKKDASLHSLDAKNVALMLREGKTRLQIPFTAKWDFPLEPAGNPKAKETTIYVIASHCPFCGQPFDVAA